jgi:hypothetical protein
VQALGEEVGVAPQLVRAAADSLRRPSTLSTAGPANKINPWISGPTRLLFERVVDGELPEAEYETLVDEIRQIQQDGGQVSQFGRSFTWTSVVPARTAVCATTWRSRSLSARGGPGSPHENLSNLIGGVFGGIGGGMGGAGGPRAQGILGGASPVRYRAVRPHLARRHLRNRTLRVSAHGGKKARRLRIS